MTLGGPLLALLPLLLAACSGGVDTDMAGRRGACEDSGGSPAPDRTWLCPDGPFECPWDKACVDGVCVDGCSTADQCHPLDGCGPGGACGACLTQGECRAEESCVEGVCVPEIPTWELELTRGDWASLEAHLGDETFYVPAVLRVPALDFEGECEARFRGGSTLDFPKRSFRLVFPEGAEYPGFSRKINLRAEYNDPTALRTRLGLAVQERLSPVPSAQARYIAFDLRLAESLGDGTPAERYGLMLEVERVGGRFLETRGRDRDALMYEAAGVDEHGALTPDDAYESYYVPETGDPEDTSALVSLIEDALYMDWIDSMVAGETVSRRSSEAIHMDAYRRSLAALALLQSHDHVTNNFHFSLQAQPESAPAWEFYMEDLDLSFGCLWNSSQRSSFCEEVSWDGWWFEGVYSLDQDEAADFELGRTPYWGNLAIHFALMEASSREAYEALLCEFLGSRFWRSRLPGIVRGLAAHIEEDVRTDPQDRYGEIDDWRAAVDDLQHFIEARGDYLEGAVPCP